jgi:hypothetical protein
MARWKIPTAAIPNMNNNTSTNDHKEALAFFVSKKTIIRNLESMKKFHIPPTRTIGSSNLQFAHPAGADP